MAGHDDVTIGSSLNRLALSGMALSGIGMPLNRVRPARSRVEEIWDSWDNFMEFLGRDVTASASEGSFSVLDVDLMKKQNRSKHRTDRYEHTELIVRRGQLFKVKVKVNQKFEDNDVIKLQFMTGDTPRESAGTMFLVTPGKLRQDSGVASAQVTRVTDDISGGSVIHLDVALPYDSTIGRFSINVRLLNKDSGSDNTKYSTYKVPEQIIVLYNPWNKDDSVYMASEDHRQEYVMAENGQVFVGTRPHGKPWAFGQFDQVSLDAALYVLEISKLSNEAFGNPVRVIRTLSAMLNSEDNDKGVLTGNWTGDFSGGVPPTDWNGSVRILEQYMETKKDVKFGQCWVFSGLSVTLCRALGIPTRSTTTITSGIDRDKSMTIDYHVTESGVPLRHLDDATWNFHVWAEGFCTRTDLSKHGYYNGWQAFDPTPQESSEGIMQCGPAPLAAIKSGNVHLGYDTKFFYAEVNADRVTWELNALQERRAIDLQTDAVGHRISTKRVGRRGREDITDQYKHPEGSMKEREVAEKVSLRSSRRDELRKLYDLDAKHDVTMSFDGQVNEKGNAEFTMRAVNDSEEERTVVVRVTLAAHYYSGVDGETLKEVKEKWTLAPSEEKLHSIELKAADWLNKVSEDASIGVYVVGRVRQTRQAYIYRESYSVDKPELNLKVLTPLPAKVGKPLEVEISFKNLLDIPLTKNYFNVEGAGIASVSRITIEDTIAPGSTVVRIVSVTPKMAGEREVIASFHSRQLVGISGEVDVTITE